MPSEDKGKARSEHAKRQEQITKQWQAFATHNGKQAYEDLMQYIDDQREMFRKYAENQAMPHPNPQKAGEMVPIDNDMVAALLQNSRGLSIVKTYIASRVDSGVAQPNNTTK